MMRHSCQNKNKTLNINDDGIWKVPKCIGLKTSVWTDIHWSAQSWCMSFSLVYCWGWFNRFALVDSLPSWLVSPDFGTCSYQCLLSDFTPVSLHMLKHSSAHTLSCPFMYYSFASIGHADIMWSIVSSNCWHSLHLLPVSVCNTVVAQYFDCNVWSCAATISLSVFPRQP